MISFDSYFQGTDGYYTVNEGRYEEILEWMIDEVLTSVSIRMSYGTCEISPGVETVIREHVEGVGAYISEFEVIDLATAPREDLPDRMRRMEYTQKVRLIRKALLADLMGMRKELWRRAVLSFSREARHAIVRVTQRGLRLVDVSYFPPYPTNQS